MSARARSGTTLGSKARTGLELDSPVRAIDARVANRRMGWTEKGPPAHEVLAESLGIRTVGQLLHHYPRRYIDRSEVSSIRELRVGQHATAIARVYKVAQRRTRKGRPMITVTLRDVGGYLFLPFFNQPWVERMYRPGHEVAVSGTVGLYGGKLQMRNFEVEVLRGDDDPIHSGRITPVHRASERITTRTIRELVFRALDQIGEISDPLPPEVGAPEHVASLDWSLRRIHFPESREELERARERLKFDELFTLELGVAFRKHRVTGQEQGIAHGATSELVARFVEALPFHLTSGQERALSQLREAMARPHPMNVLLQGDVGSGKTVVAVAACLVAADSGHQAAIMAPTEVLAGQHSRNVEALLAPIGATRIGPGGDDGGRRGQPSLFESQEGPAAPSTTRNPIRFALLTAAVTGRERARILEASAAGQIDLVIGTHALVQEGVAFRDLSLAVIDEQHRFGVHQRMALKGKGASPDVLIMTATPIPRTLALTYYGDLDVSVLDELPAGRQPIETRVARSAQARRDAYELVRGEVRAGRQAFVVCAAIDQENRLEVRAAEKEAERLAGDVFPELRVGLLHGRMRPPEKEARMEAFRSGSLDVLISTTVIEVGVDVPNATVMLVENAERFGLAQLHQLRGRIGRGEHRSFCVLFDESAPDNQEARERLEAMVRTTDGFELADEDLRLRGEGTLFDVRQSGLPDLRLAKLSEDLDLVKRARARAFDVIDRDPSLEAHPALRAELESRFADSIDWLFHT
jgi:ATP-dependent DNA helicase RecG